MPVSSYAPEFLEIFKRGASEEFIIPVGNETKAMRLRFRLHSLRVDMRKEEHTLKTIANSVQFSITHNGDLKCSPADNNFLADIRKAGIEVTAPIADSLSTTEPLHKAEREDAEEAIRKFLNPGVPKNE